MRLWSIHPKYLDQKGLGACWREGLLAQKVLKATLFGQDIGYKNHPQLDRFKVTESNHPINETMALIGQYLFGIWQEAKRRGYNYDLDKIELLNSRASLPVTYGQLNYEWKHLENKLDDRHSQDQFDKNCQYTNYGKNIEPHPLFKPVNGDIEPWEKIT